MERHGTVKAHDRTIRNMTGRVILGALFWATTVWGFGQNKVQYTGLKWRCATTTHLSLYYHQGQAGLPGVSSVWAEKAYASLSRQFLFTHRERVPLIVYGSPNLFEQTNIIGELIPEGVGGFTELFKNRVVLPFNGSYTEYRHVVHHELVHAFEFGIMFDSYAGFLMQNSSAQLPLWFAEGLAEYLSSGWDSEADMFLMDKAIAGDVPLPGPELDGYMAYKGGQSFLHYLATSRGDSTFLRFLRAFKETRRVETAFKKVYNKPIEDLGAQWKQELKRLYWPEIGRRQDPEKNATSLTKEIRPRAFYNLRPRISPDGSRIAFFSDSRDFTRIVIANREGKEIGRINQNGYGGYFESFHPFRSGMCWSPSGDRLAFVTKTNGRDEIRIAPVKNRGKHRRIALPQLDGISSPDWSHTDSSLVFTAIHEGSSDLFLYSLANATLTQLTGDLLFESDPRFSRDGKSVVFAREDTSGSTRRNGSVMTDRPTSDLFSMDLATRTISRLTATPWNEKQPCYSGNGKSLVFVSDRNGIDNLYLAPVDSLDKALPFTDIIGGCSNPDWARNHATLTYCLFQKGTWNVLVMDNPRSKTLPSPLQPTKWVEFLNDSTKEFFTRVAPDVNTALKKDSAVGGDTGLLARRPGITPANPDTGAVVTDSTDTTVVIGGADSAISRAPTVIKADTVRIPDTTAASMLSDKARVPQPDPGRITSDKPYTLKFSPDLVTFGLGVSPAYGPAGQWLIVLSDLMGDHRITVAGDVQGRLDKYAHVFASYLNTKYRLNFGIGGFYNRDYTSASLMQDSIYFDTDIGGMLMLSLPFSLWSRIDLNTYYSHVYRQPWYRDTTEYTPGSTRQLDILVPTISGSFDNIVWGLTGPVNGTRAAASITAVPPMKSIAASYVSIDLDGRNYLHFDRRYVWANRVAVGYSHPLKDNGETRRYFLGGTENWLNRDVNMEQYGSNVCNIFYSDFVVPFRGWNYFDLTGSRYAVVNTEFRFPFIKEISLVWPLPMKIQYINGALFTDVGNAWDAQDQVKGTPFPMNIYGGIGFGLRANLGIFVLRYDRAWRTDWQRYVDSPVNYWSLGGDF